MFSPLNSSHKKLNELIRQVSKAVKSDYPDWLKRNPIKKKRPETLTKKTVTCGRC